MIRKRHEKMGVLAIKLEFENVEKNFDVIENENTPYM